MIYQPTKLKPEEILEGLGYRKIVRGWEKKLPHGGRLHALVTFRGIELHLDLSNAKVHKSSSIHPTLGRPFRQIEKYDLGEFKGYKLIK